jgi:8-oxo-dGTP diphosphatase
VEFVGAKAALFCDGGVLTCLRDDHPGLPWPGLWDLPGGGREGRESPEDCLLRELAEEFGLAFPSTRLIWRRAFPSIVDGARQSFFFAGWITAREITSITFGNEGQGWDLMPVRDFLGHKGAVPEMQRRAGIAWAELGPTFRQT